MRDSMGTPCWKNTERLTGAFEWGDEARLQFNATITN